MIRLVRVLRVANKKNVLLKFARSILKFSKGFERLSFFFITSLLICHIFACLWIFFSNFTVPGDDTWMDDKMKEMPIFDLYITSFYFTITTFSTVGYGDISGQNKIERIFCIILMIFGVTAFAWGTSALTNLLQTYDQEDDSFHQKVQMLNRIYSEYRIPLKLYDNVKKSISF